MSYISKITLCLVAVLTVSQLEAVNYPSPGTFTNETGWVWRYTSTDAEDNDRDETIEGVRYCDGSAVLVDYVGKGGNVTIPSYVSYKDATKSCHAVVRAVGGREKIIESDHETHALEFGIYREKVTGLTIAGTVRGIGAHAFCGGEQLEFVTSTTNSVLECVGYEVFSRCNKLKSIALQGKKLRQFSWNVMYASTNLQEVFIDGDGSLNIDGGMFCGCAALKKVRFGDGVKSIRTSNRDDLKGWAYISYSTSTKYYTPGFIFEGCTNLEEIDLGNGIQEIGDEAFRECKFSGELRLPKSVRVVGDHAFYEASITSLVFESDQLQFKSDSGGETWPFSFMPLKSIVFKGSSAPISWRGDYVWNSAIDGTPSGCVIYVMPGSTGWDGITGSDVLPPTWPTNFIYDASVKCSGRKITFIPITLTYDENGGDNAIDAVTRTPREALGALPTPTRESHAFVGWSLDKAGKQMVSASTLVPDESATLYAQWKIERMKLSAEEDQPSDYTLTVEGAGVLTFDWRTSCEESDEHGLRDHAELLLDGEVVATRDGDSLWSQVSIDIAGGSSHTLTWRYTKDDSGSAGEDCMWISGVQFTSIADEETLTDLLDESEYNWFYEDEGFACSDDSPFEYVPRQAPEESVDRVDVSMEIDPITEEKLQMVDTSDLQGCIVKIFHAEGLEYAVLTSDGWTMAGNESIGSTDAGAVVVSMLLDYSKTPSRITYLVAGHTLTNEAGVSSFACARQESSVRTVGATGVGKINAWAGKYTVANSDVQEVASNSVTELAANLDTFSNETFRVVGGGTLVIPGDKIPAGGINRKLHVDGNSAVEFDLTGLSAIPTVTKLFNGVGKSFVVGDNMKVVVSGEGVERLSRLFVKDGNLEARVAERPTLENSSAESPFSMTSDGDAPTASASIGNAVEGFWYGLETTGLLGVDFLLDPYSVKQCTSTGTLKVESSANADSGSGFYRVSVRAEDPAK